MQLIYWLTAALSITGVVLNIRQHVACFYLWTLTNATWATVDWAHGLEAQAVLMTIYCGLSIWGICNWRKRKQNDGAKNPH